MNNTRASECTDLEVDSIAPFAVAILAKPIKPYVNDLCFPRLIIIKVTLVYQRNRALYQTSDLYSYSI